MTITDLELAAEYAAAAEAWRAFAQRPADADPMGEPLAVVLLATLRGQLHGRPDR